MDWEELVQTSWFNGGSAGACTDLHCYYHLPPLFAPCRITSRSVKGGSSTITDLQTMTGKPNAGSRTPLSSSKLTRPILYMARRLRVLRVPWRLLEATERVNRT